jgi:hypothetical protein
MAVQVRCTPTWVRHIGSMHKMHEAICLTEKRYGALIVIAGWGKKCKESIFRITNMGW